MQRENEQWDLVIENKKSWFDINFKELWEYRDLVGLFVRRDFVAKYKQTILGPLWFVIQPLMTTLMFVVVFGRIAKIPTDGQPMLLFYLTGIVIWNYLANCFRSTSNTFITNASIFGKVYFPRLVSPISIVVSNFIQFGIQFGLLIAIFLIYCLLGYVPHLTIYITLLPILILLMASLGFGLGILFSALTTKYRDLFNVIDLFIQLWMYATPIIYPLSSVKGKLYYVVALNPVSSIVETFRCGLLGVGTISWGHLLYSLIVIVVILVSGILVFNRVERNFMDTI